MGSGGASGASTSSPRIPIAALWHYIEWQDGQRELYDLRTDPNQLRNVAGGASYASVQARLATDLSALTVDAHDRHDAPDSCKAVTIASKQSV